MDKTYKVLRQNSDGTWFTVTTSIGTQQAWGYAKGIYECELKQWPDRLHKFVEETTVEKILLRNFGEPVSPC